MNLSQVKPGSLLEIYIRRDGANYRVVSKVEYVDDKCIGVSPIASKTRLFRFADTDIVDIVCKQDDNSWKWAGVKPGILEFDDGTTLHCFVPVKEAETFNRRSTYRLPLDREITISYEKAITDADELAAQKKDSGRQTIEEVLDQISDRYCELTSKAYIKDISEGGAAMSSEATLKKGDIISFEFELAYEPVKCKAVIVRVKPSTGKDYYENNYGVSFVETSTNFVKCFFAEQRKIINKKKVNFQL